VDWIDEQVQLLPPFLGTPPWTSSIFNKTNTLSKPLPDDEYLSGTSETLSVLLYDTWIALSGCRILDSIGRSHGLISRPDHFCLTLKNAPTTTTIFNDSLSEICRHCLQALLQGWVRSLQIAVYGHEH